MHDTLIISTWGTSQVEFDEISSYLFYNFIHLIDIIEKLDTGNVNNMSKIFYNDSSLINIDVSDWNTSEVNNMSEMFR